MSCKLCGKEDTFERRININGKNLKLCNKHYNLINKAKSANTKEDLDKIMSELNPLLENQPEEIKDLVLDYINNNDPLVTELQELKKNVKVIRNIAIVFLVVLAISIIGSLVFANSVSNTLEEAFSNSSSYDYDDYDYDDNDY